MPPDHESEPLSYRPANMSGSVPIPDPTALTDKAIARLKEQLDHDMVNLLAVRDQRINSIEQATELRRVEMQAIRAEIVIQTEHAKSLLEIHIKYAERDATSDVAHQREISDIRFAAEQRLAERESELNALALAAAFAAQKEASSREAEYNRVASVKTETQFSGAVEKLGELFNSRIGSVEGKVDDTRDRVSRIESRAVGQVDQRTETRAVGFDMRSTVLMVVGLIGLALTISAALIGAHL